MNFNVDFIDIRSIVVYANDHIEKLDKIQFLCGYQNAITDITHRLRERLRSKAYLNFENDADPEHHHQLRRIVFYMMLNTDVTLAAPHDLNNHVDVVHVLQNMPQLPPFLLLNLLWSLRLHQFLSEAIANTPAWFAVAYIDRAVDSLLGSSVPELNRASRAAPLVVAIFETVQRTASDDARFVNVSLELVRQFLTCTADQLEPMSKTKCAKLLGYVMMHSLATAQRCVQLFVDRNAPAPVADASVASVFGNFSEQPTQEVVAKTEPSDGTAAAGTLLQLVMGQLNAVQTSAMQINLDIFLYWAEWDLDEEFTMQRHIGEAAHRLLEQLDSESARHSGVQHDVCAQLRTIALRPKTIAEVMRAAPLGEIMSKLDSLDLEPETRAQWLDEFLSRGILVYGNDECMDTLEGNLEHLSIEHIAHMIRAVHELHTVMDDSGDHLRQHVYQAASRRSAAADVYALIAGSLQVNPPTGVDLELESLAVATISLFNRCTPALLRSHSTLALMLQNPMRFVQHALNRALDGDELLADVCAFLDELPAEVRAPDAVRAALTALVQKCERLPAGDQARLSVLLHRLHRTQFGKPAAFYQLFYRLVCEASSAGHGQTVLTLLTALQLVLHHSIGPGKASNATPATPTNADWDVLPTMAAPLLVLCAALMDTYRWDIATFSAQREHIVRLSIEIMHELRRRFLPVANDADRQFICDRVAGFAPHTRYYYQRFGLQRDQQPRSFAAFVCPVEATATGEGVAAPLTTETILERLLGAMVRSTRKECAMLTQNETLRPYWFLTVALMGRVVNRSVDPQSDQRTANSWACLRYVGQSLAYIVRVSTDCWECSEVLSYNCILFVTE